MRKGEQFCLARRVQCKTDSNRSIIAGVVVIFLVGLLRCGYFITTTTTACDADLDSKPISSDLIPATTWLKNISNHEWKIYSQKAQDGVLDFLFQPENVGTTNKYFVEFGVNDVNNKGSGSNTRFLFEHRGWKGLLLDSKHQNPSINLHAHKLSPDNICDIFALYHVPRAPDYVSVDVDSIDLWLFKAIISQYRPRVLTVEYNSNWPCDDVTTFTPDGEFPRPFSPRFGASLSSLYLVGKEHGYAMVHAEPRLDVFFVRADILRERGVDDIEDVLPYWQTWPKFCNLPLHGRIENLTSEDWKSLMPYESSEKLPPKP